MPNSEYSERDRYIDRGPNVQHVRAIDNDSLLRALKIRSDVMTLTGQKLINEYQERTAQTLLEASLTLIPCDTLRDHEFIVSRGVYEAAKRQIKK